MFTKSLLLSLSLEPGIVKPFCSYCAVISYLSLFMAAGCNSERVASSPTSLREQEVVRFQAAPNKGPVFFGQVQSVDDAGRYPVPTASVSVDGRVVYTNALGMYRTPVTPGKHQMVVEHTGMRPSRTTVKVERGDSVQVNFYLRYVD
jgi:hypothetical protein